MRSILLFLFIPLISCASTSKNEPRKVSFLENSQIDACHNGNISACETIFQQCYKQGTEEAQQVLLLTRKAACLHGHDESCTKLKQVDKMISDLKTACYNNQESESCFKHGIYSYYRTYNQDVLEQSLDLSCQLGHKPGCAALNSINRARQRHRDEVNNYYRKAEVRHTQQELLNKSLQNFNKSLTPTSKSNLPRRTTCQTISNGYGHYQADCTTR